MAEVLGGESMAKISVMFSGSRGNCTYIASGNSSLLVDVGVSAKQVILGLEQRMLDPKKLGGIFITHSHTDHVAGLKVFLKKYNIPVYATKETLGALILNDVFNAKSRYYDIENYELMLIDFYEYSKENANKIVSHYKELGYETIIKEYEINNSKFLSELSNYDSLILSTEDKTVLSSLISQVLSKYEEVVINGKD